MHLNLEHRISVLINPNAGSGNKKLAAHAERLCAPYPAQVSTTHTLIGMKQLVQRYLNDGIDLFVVCGGDGTLAATTNQIAKYCALKDIKLPKIAYIPAGTGNLLKTLIDIEGIEDPLTLLLKKYQEGEELPTRPFKLVKTEFVDVRTEEPKSLFYTMAGCGMDAALLQDFEKVCRGKSGFFTSGAVGYAHSINRRTIPREILSLFQRFQSKGDVLITASEGVQKVACPAGKETLYSAHTELYQGPQAQLHTVLAATTPTAGFGVVAFPHLDMVSQYRPTNPMQIRILQGPKHKVVGHLLNNIFAIAGSKYRSGEFFEEFLVGEGGHVNIDYSTPCPLQVGGDFIAEVISLKYLREGTMELVDWKKLAV